MALPGSTPGVADRRPVLTFGLVAPHGLRLVGHSFGGAVALWAARTLEPRVSHLVLY